MTSAGSSSIARHRTAIGRATLSKPMRLALEAGLLEAGTTVMDYGCGRGDDIRRLRRKGYDVVGWDPAHRPDGPRRPSAVVNLGYVLNVIENPPERAEVLQAAWGLAEEALVVAALVKVDTNTTAVPYGDGIVTSRGTFQKYYEHQELEVYLRQVLEEEPIALGLGIFAITRNPARRAELLARRFRRRPRALPRATAQSLFEDNRELLQPLLDYVVQRGRAPTQKEAERFPLVCERFGSLRRAVRLVQRALPEDLWAQAAASAKDDLMVYLALSRFGGRPRFSELDGDMQDDVRVHFGSYRKATAQADELLYSLGEPGVLRRAASHAALGKKLPDDLYVHVEAVASLPLILRLFEGCARRYLGGVEGADLVKLHLRRPKISYLTYPNFWKDPHPTLQRSLQVDLQTFRVRVDDYSGRENPPILHRKELFIESDHPKHALFSRLTRQEESAGILDDFTKIGTRRGWMEVLGKSGLELRGHRLLQVQRAAPRTCS